jgi:hypothetical protein
MGWGWDVVLCREGGREGGEGYFLDLGLGFSGLE